MAASAKLRLSVLDQSPVPSGSTPADALQNSISLARHVDALGFHRLWYSEHHAMDTLACSAPEVLLARIGAETRRIRIGSGGIMLPHYAPLKVAEVFRTLEDLYPDRIDLGVGRAPGGGPVESHALRRVRSVPAPDDFPQQLGELLAFLHPEMHLFPAGHPFARIKVSPALTLPSVTRPDLWLLGSSMWSAVTAAANGLPYAFAHFFSSSGNTTRAAIEHYQQNFQPSAFRAKPEATIAIGAIVAGTQAEADRLHASVRLLQRRIRMDDRRPIATPEEALLELGNPPPAGFGFSLSDPDAVEFPRYIVGTPDHVRAELTRIASELDLDELILNTITHSHEARLRSYTLLAEAFQLQTN
jgi:luciferase family oxidoreductase group 1